jgi:hypothetical protein
MNTMPCRRLVHASAFVAVLVAAPLDAQTRGAAAPVGIQTAPAADVVTLADKFGGLAQVLDGKCDWKPGVGVRSVADVLNLIVMENRMLAGTLTGAPAPPGGRHAVEAVGKGRTSPLSWERSPASIGGVLNNDVPAEGHPGSATPRSS